MTTVENFLHNSKHLPIDEFLDNVLYKKGGYYSSVIPFGSDGDFITSPGISNLFSEIISIWLISTWQVLGKPKKINIIELGPGDGSLTKILVKTIKNFPNFKDAANIYLYEKSKFLKKLQKKNINNSKVKWVKDFKNIKGGPVIFFGNEFFDAIPIKQFLRKKNLFFEKYISLNKKQKIVELYKEVKDKDILEIKKYKSIKNLKFIEYPKLGFKELSKVTKIISKKGGGILLIDYGYLESKNKSTLQSIYEHKKNYIFNNLGKADITYLVNFKLLKEFFTKNNLKVKNIVSQKFFLEKMGIKERADQISKKMPFKEKVNLYLRLKRLVDERFMGSLFKVIFAYKFHKNNFFGFK